MFFDLGFELAHSGTWTNNKWLPYGGIELVALSGGIPAQTLLLSFVILITKSSADDLVIKITEIMYGVSFVPQTKFPQHFHIDFNLGSILLSFSSWRRTLALSLLCFALRCLCPFWFRALISFLSMLPSVYGSRLLWNTPPRSFHPQAPHLTMSVASPNLCQPGQNKP